MTQLAAVTITKAQLDHIPTEERLFYLMAGQLLNDVNILSKLLTAASNELKLVEQEPPKRSAAIAQVLLLLKLTAGRLCEGYDMIGQVFSAKGFLRKYKSDMSPATLTSLNAMNKFFAGESAIQRIRSKFALHLDAESIASAYANAPHDFTSVEYLSDQYSGHNLFHTSETLGLIAMVGADLEMWRETIDQIVAEVRAACATVATFLIGFISVIFARYLGSTIKHLEVADITITDDPPLADMRLPFFCQPPEQTASDR